MKAQRYITEEDTKKHNKEKETIVYMRENIRELNRSMESIQKMIERSRQLINRSRQPSLNSNSLQRQKENRRDKELLLSSIKKHYEYQTTNTNQKQTKTVHRQISLINSNQSDQVNNRKKIGLKTNQKYNKPIDFRNSTKPDRSSQKKNNSLLNKSGNMNIVTNRSKQKSKQKTQMESPFKQIQENNKIFYKFSPQKTKSIQVIQTKSKQKSHPTHPQNATQQKLNKPQAVVKQQPFKLDLSFLSRTNLAKQNILIEQEENQQSKSNFNTFSAKEYRFKTQHTQQTTGDIYSMYKIEQPSSNITIKNQKRKINLKLFQSESKKSCLASQRSKKSIYESVRLSTRKNLVKQLGQLQTQSTSEEQRKAKFILKIKKYGFVQKHLSEEQIWNIYDQLVESNIPQLKWPIVIVDQVYQKMKLYQ